MTNTTIARWWTDDLSISADHDHVADDTVHRDPLPNPPGVVDADASSPASQAWNAPTGAPEATWWNTHAEPIDLLRPAAADAVVEPAAVVAPVVVAHAAASLDVQAGDVIWWTSKAQPEGTIAPTAVAAPAATEPAAPIAAAPSSAAVATAPVATAPVATAPVATAPVATAPVATAPGGVIWWNSSTSSTDTHSTSGGTDAPDLKPTDWAPRPPGTDSGAVETACPPVGEAAAEVLTVRAAAAHSIRYRAADIAYSRDHDAHATNGDEFVYEHQNWFGNFSKGLPHDAKGQVDRDAYRALQRAARTGRRIDFEAIPLGGTRKLTSPQAGLAFDLEGPDAQSLTMPAPPAFASATMASEMLELYWMSMLRDVPFVEWEQNADINAACDELAGVSAYEPNVRGRSVTPANIFRGNASGDHVGPHISQFLYKPIPYGSLHIEQTTEQLAPGIDYLTSWDAWLAVQNGTTVPKAAVLPSRYMTTIRDLARYVQVDALYEAYLNAALILLGSDAKVDAGNGYANSTNQAPFATWGGPHLLSLVTEVASRALKAVWFQKWMVHRRLRPEEFGGRVHLALTGQRDYPIHGSVLDSHAVSRLHDANKSFLLPIAFPEGCPTHPAYGAGHATVAGACVTILKAWFDESQPIASPVIPTADGGRLVPYSGPGSTDMTVGGELDKVAANIAIGRNMAGVHWRSDYTQSVRLGEQVALQLLQEQSLCYNELASFTVTTVSGAKKRIADGLIASV
jgi:hypothetical protein